MVDDDPADEDAVLEVDLEAVDVVSFGLAAVSSGFNALEPGSILAPTTPCVELMSLPGCFYLCLICLPFLFRQEFLGFCGGATMS